MSASWLTILVIAAATIVIRAAGPTVLGARQLPEPGLRVVALLPVALLAALVVVLTFQSDGGLVLDARVIGVGVGLVAILLRVPVLAVVLLAGAATAVARAAGIG